jgi:hypothetical protein
MQYGRHGVTVTHRREREDETHEHGAGGDAVREQRKGHVAARKPFAHDAGADDSGNEQSRSGLGVLRRQRLPHSLKSAAVLRYRRL